MADTLFEVFNGVFTLGLQAHGKIKLRAVKQLSAVHIALDAVCEAFHIAAVDKGHKTVPVASF